MGSRAPLPGSRIDLTVMYPDRGEVLSSHEEQQNSAWMKESGWSDSIGTRRLVGGVCQSPVTSSAVTCAGVPLLLVRLHAENEHFVTESFKAALQLATRLTP